ncbi:Like-Sm (LSM) domain-containing protein [Artemisia annua]|uniref:Small nuclear ribonucleoprotein Sm D2 n=1 Tax=Artemisia annua TaxID=35608 RepID=A0A2U1Q015_ARTAN|nr:Like-Sm (LSM) domain-containing protein [Artemisia annua]
MDDLEFHPIISAEILNISRDISGDGVQQASIKMLEGTVEECYFLSTKQNVCPEWISLNKAVPFQWQRKLFANQDTGKSENTASRISTQSKYSTRDDFLNKLLTKNIIELLDFEQIFLCLGVGIPPPKIINQSDPYHIYLIFQGNVERESGVVAPKTDKGKKKALPVNKDRFLSKLFLCGDSVINVLRNPKSKVIITALNALFVDKAGSKPLLLVRINIQCQ